MDAFCLLQMERERNHLQRRIDALRAESTKFAAALDALESENMHTTTAVGKVNEHLAARETEHSRNMATMIEQRRAMQARCEANEREMYSVSSALRIC